MKNSLQLFILILTAIAVFHRKWQSGLLTQAFSGSAENWFRQQMQYDPGSEKCRQY
jgi:hypothetical protein